MTGSDTLVFTSTQSGSNNGPDEWILTDGGVVAHSFWFGSKVEEHEGLHFAYYTESDLRDIFDEDFDVLTMERYEELEADDSIFLVLKKRIVYR